MKIVLKVFVVLLLIIVLLIIGAISFFMILRATNNAYKGNFMTTMASGNASARKALVVYQPSSSKGPTNIAYELARGLQEQGYDVTITYPGKHVLSDVSEYALLAFGSPVFMGQPSKALTNTMNRLDGLDGKTIIVYSVGQLETAPELEVLQAALPNGKAGYTKKFRIDDVHSAYEFGKTEGIAQ